MLSGVSENLTFHASPESFIVNHVLHYHKQHPGEVANRVPLRAKILNRNVIIVSAYHQVRAVLCPRDERTDDEGDGKVPYVAAAPYKRLMEAFFPPPNLLLNDGCPHRKMKEPWAVCVQSLESEKMQSRIVARTSGLIKRLVGSEAVDLYKELKELSWEIFLSTVLDFSPADQGYAEYVRLQEDLLRGQFSLLPVSINAGIWHSPRKTGIGARKKLQSIILDRLRSRRPVWISEDVLKSRPEEEIVNHLLMSTSSLAVKAFSSLLLAFLLNVYLFGGDDAVPGQILKWIATGSPQEAEEKAEAVLQETLRLSPPIVGVMRRATTERTLPSLGSSESDTMVPASWDVWSYFPGANRDHAVFGGDADYFKMARYLVDDSRLPPPIAFGLGSKTCLGQQFVFKAATAVLQAFRQSRVELKGSVISPGMKGWLGWEIASPEQWAKDIKQLPTQRPSKPTMIHVIRNT